MSVPPFGSSVYGRLEAGPGRQPVMIAILTLLAFAVRGWKMAIGTVLAQTSMAGYLLLRPYGDSGSSTSPAAAAAFAGRAGAVGSAAAVPEDGTAPAGGPAKAESQHDPGRVAPGHETPGLSSALR